MHLGTKQRRKSSVRTSYGSSSRTSTSGHTNAIRTRPHCPPPSLKGSRQSASGPNSSIPTDEAAVPRSCNPSPLRITEFDDRDLLGRRGATRHHINRKAPLNERSRPCLPGSHRQRRVRDDQAARQPHRPGTFWAALLFAREDGPCSRRD